MLLKTNRFYWFLVSLIFALAVVCVIVPLSNSDNRAELNSEHAVGHAAGCDCHLTHKEQMVGLVDNLNESTIEQVTIDPSKIQDAELHTLAFNNWVMQSNASEMLLTEEDIMTKGIKLAPR